MKLDQYYTLYFDVNYLNRDLERLESPIYSVKAHKEIINAIDGVGGLGIGEGAPEIVTASRDGIIKINHFFFNLIIFKLFFKKDL